MTTGTATTSTAKPDLDSMESLSINPAPEHPSGRDYRSLPPEPQHAPRRGTSIWIWIGVIGISFLAGKYLEIGHHGGGSNHQSSGGELVKLPAVTSAEVPDGTTVVTTASVEERPVRRSVQAVGTFHGFEEVVLSSKLEGRVAKIHFDLAAVVRPGDLLLELDSVDARLTVQQAERNLETELTKWGFTSVPEPETDVSELPSVVSARLRYELALSRWKRMQPLHASKSITADELEQVRSEAQIFESEWKNQQLQAISAVATARLRAADLAIAEQRLKDCEIRVPQPTLAQAAGEDFYTISQRLVSEGTLLRPGTEVFQLVLGRSLKLRLSVPESSSGQIKLGQSVNVHVAAQKEPEPGTVTNISPAIDRTTRTLLVEVTVPNLSGICRPGGFAKADILVGGKETAIVVPADSVYSLAGNQKIFLLHEGRAEEHLVTLGQQTTDWVEIATPAIPLGAKVATSGQRYLFNGASVVERNDLAEGTSEKGSAPLEAAGEGQPPFRTPSEEKR